MNEKDAFRNLANAIVIQAVDDWRTLCQRIENTNSLNPQTKKTFYFTSLRTFLKSDWCAQLCGAVNPLFILDALERERKAALDKHLRRTT